MTSTVDERLPTPKLDDRRFQDLVDEAKRRIQQRCPEWTNHNVSDPGVTLIEAFAWMTDQLLYRLNRVPELNYVKFLELLGVRLLPPTAAHVDVTFRLSKAQDKVLEIPAGTQISTPRTGAGTGNGGAEQITFATSVPLPIVPCSSQSLASSDAFGGVRVHDDLTRVACFSDRPRPGDALLLGLDRAVPSCMVRLELPCRQGAGGGIAPDNPPLVWDARVGDDEGSVHLWNARTRELVRRFSGNRGHALHRIAFSPDGHMLASAGYGTIWVRDAHEIEQPGQRLEGHDSRVLALAFSADGATLVSAGDDGSIRLWNVHDAEQPPRTLGRGDRPAHGGPVFAVAFDRLGTMLASAGADGMVRLWDIASGERREWDVGLHRDAATPPAPDYRRCPICVSLLEDGRVAAAGDDGSVWLCDPAATKPVTAAEQDAEQAGLPQSERRLPGHRGPVFGAAFSPDGLRLATVGDDGTGRLWNVAPGDPQNGVPESPLHVLLGHQGPIYSVVFGPDGHTLGTVGGDWTARLWSVATGEQLQQPVSDHCLVHDIAFHPTGDLVATAGLDGGWERCEIESDDTKGLNEKNGHVVLHVPPAHCEATIAEQAAGWLRCRVRAVDRGQSPYDKTPVLEAAVKAETFGGTVTALNAETVLDEVIGVSEGVAGQRFPLQRRPVVPMPGNETHVLEVRFGGRTEEWHEVTDFASATKDDQCFVVDHVAGELVLGPTVRERNETDARTETYHAYGAVPRKGAELRLRRYLTGGGRRGNVKERTLTVLRSPIANVAAVENRQGASGGVDGEDIENAKVRGPITLRTANRAVTAEDYEQLAREAAPELARVECIPATDEKHAGEAHVLVIPKVESDNGELRFEQLVPAVGMINRIKDYLDRRRVIGTRVLVTPPNYHGFTIAAKLLARREFAAEDVKGRTLAALYEAFSPISGGRDGNGWEFGRPVLQGDVYAVLQSVPGVDRVDDCRLFEANPVTGQRTVVANSSAPGDQPRKIEVSRYATIFSYRHYVVVEPQ